MNQTAFFHARVKGEDFPSFVMASNREVSNNGGATICVRKDGLNLHWAIAKCVHYDNFCRAEGRKWAEKYTYDDAFQTKDLPFPIVVNLCKYFVERYLSLYDGREKTQLFFEQLVKHMLLYFNEWCETYKNVFVVTAEEKLFEIWFHAIVEVQREKSRFPF